MKKTYITFGQNHVHRIGGKTFDCDCVAVIYASSADEGRDLAFKAFGSKFCFEYFDDQWEGHITLHHFPRGYIELNSEDNK